MTTEAIFTAIYVRVAAEQAAPEVLENQMRLCDDYARRHGLGPTIVFSDVGSAGARVRPGFAQMMDLVRDGGVNTIIAVSLVRLARKLDQLNAIMDELKAHNVTLRTIDAGTHDMADFIRIVAWMDEKEREANKERQALGRAAAKKNRKK